jgi:hypothetical protein
MSARHALSINHASGREDHALFCFFFAMKSCAYFLHKIFTYTVLFIYFSMFIVTIFPDFKIGIHLFLPLRGVLFLPQGIGNFYFMFDNTKFFRIYSLYCAECAVEK